MAPSRDAACFLPAYRVVLQCRPDLSRRRRCHSGAPAAPSPREAIDSSCRRRISPRPPVGVIYERTIRLRADADFVLGLSGELQVAGAGHYVRGIRAISALGTGLPAFTSRPRMTAPSDSHPRQHDDGLSAATSLQEERKQNRFGVANIKTIPSKRNAWRRTQSPATASRCPPHGDRQRGESLPMVGRGQYVRRLSDRVSHIQPQSVFSPLFLMVNQGRRSAIWSTFLQNRASTERWRRRLRNKMGAGWALTARRKKVKKQWGNILNRSA